MLVIRASTAPAELDLPTGDTEVVPDRPWVVIVWNDPINLMAYVTFVFQKLFGYSKEKATSLMLDVHHKGRAVVSSGTRGNVRSTVSVNWNFDSVPRATDSLASVNGNPGFVPVSTNPSPVMRLTGKSSR